MAVTINTGCHNKHWLSQ